MGAGPGPDWLLTVGWQPISGTTRRTVNSPAISRTDRLFTVSSSRRRPPQPGRLVTTSAGCTRSTSGVKPRRTLAGPRVVGPAFNASDAFSAIGRCEKEGQRVTVGRATALLRAE